jgi:ubiquinone/menaquinone biosynthesis C-methylase UbiE
MNNLSDISGGYIEHKFVSEYYDYILPYDEDLDFYLDLAKKSGGPVLELAIGTGRTVIPIARAGIDITGVDLSSSMLDLCRVKLEKETIETQARVTLIKDDMRSFDLKKTFPLVTIPYASFTYLTEVDDQLACLESVYRHLKPGGIFFMTVFNESVEALADDSVFEEFDITPEFIMPDGRKVYRRFRYVERDYTRQVEVKDSIFYVTYPDGNKERLVHRFSMRYFFSFEIVHLLARAGLEVTGLYSDYKGAPHDAAIRDGMIIITAGKKRLQ